MSWWSPWSKSSSWQQGENAHAGITISKPIRRCFRQPLANYGKRKWEDAKWNERAVSPISGFSSFYEVFPRYKQYPSLIYCLLSEHFKIYHMGLRLWFCMWILGPPASGPWPATPRMVAPQGATSPHTQSQDPWPASAWLEILTLRSVDRPWLFWSVYRLGDLL